MDGTQFVEQQFVEDVGIVFEKTGLPRMAGRILGRLLISSPTHQSADQLAHALQASKGSISTMTRHLISFGLIERFSMTGVRHDFFRLRTDAWQKLIGRGLQDEIRMFRELAEHGLVLLADRTPETKNWLEEMRDVYSFLEQEFPPLLERWEKQRVQDKTTK